ncbi:MAG: hypothetical protein ABI972_22705 [Acidobacteriota bacterium]
MDLDIRKPLGGLLGLLGLILIVYGLASDPAQYHKSNGRNINLSWGGVLAVTGAAFLLASRRGAAPRASR